MATPPSQMSTPSLVRSDLTLLVQATIPERDRQVVAEKLMDTSETEIEKPYQGFSAESPLPKSKAGRSLSPEYRRERSEAEEELWKVEITEWLSRKERLEGLGGEISSSPSTEDAVATGLIDKISHKTTHETSHETSCKTLDGA
jgi:hypothetical protein